MLTQKEVLTISEKVMGHQALIEKYAFYANQCNDPQMKNLLRQHQQILNQHLQILMNLLQNNQSYSNPSRQTANYKSNYTTV